MRIQQPPSLARAFEIARQHDRRPIPVSLNRPLVVRPFQNRHHRLPLPVDVGREADRPVVFGLTALQEPYEAVETYFRSGRLLAERARRLAQEGRIRPAETSDGFPLPKPAESEPMRRPRPASETVR